MARSAMLVYDWCNVFGESKALAKVDIRKAAKKKDGCGNAFHGIEFIVGIE